MSDLDGYDIQSNELVDRGRSRPIERVDDREARRFFKT